MRFCEIAGREWEPRDKSDVIATAIIEDVFGIAVCEVVLILHGGDWHDATRRFDLGNIDFRKANIPDFAFLLEISQRSKLIVGWNLWIDAMQLEQFDTFDTQPSQAHLTFLTQILRPSQWNPSARARSGKASLCGDNKSFWIGMQCLANQFFTNVWSIGIGCVDKIDAELHRAAQDCDRLPSISWFTPNAGTCQLHRTVAQAVNGKITADRKRTALYGGSFFVAFPKRWRRRSPKNPNNLHKSSPRDPPPPPLPALLHPTFLRVL